MPCPEAPRVSLDVTVLWRGDPIAGARLDRDGAVIVGAKDGSLALIPCAPAECEAFEAARVAEGASIARVPAGAIGSLRGASGAFSIVFGPAEVRLDRGDALDLPLGDFRVHVSADAPVEIARAPIRAPRGAAHLVVAAAAHAVALGLAAQAASASSAADAEDDRTETMQKLMVSAEQRARAPKPPTEDTVGEGKGRDIAHRHGDGRAGGARAAGKEGAMGDPKSGAKDARFALPGKTKALEEVAVSRADALRDATSFGMIGVIAEGSPRQSPWAAYEQVSGHDALGARGSMFGEELGITFGSGGLGLSGVGEGGGGRGEGIGIGSIGTLGIHGLYGGGLRELPIYNGGSYSPYSQRSYHCDVPTRRRPAPRVHCAPAVVKGQLAYAGMNKLLGCQSAQIRRCYQTALDSNGTLAGTITVRFVIGREGTVDDAASGGSTIDHPELVACVVGAFRGLSFPRPESGIVTVSYPINLSPPPEVAH